MLLSTAVLDEVQHEAIRAHDKHGGRSMYWHKTSHERRLAILTEEVGEVAKELNEGDIRQTGPDLAKLRAEAIQVAAMALTWVQAIDDA